ncbi:MAG TPA: DUF4838 domain-containing protein [Flavobacteriaceae bacterium]|nr:DUF4838 domain-containing protein [Flavobacteriaceae bacterium]
MAKDKLKADTYVIITENTTPTPIENWFFQEMISYSNRDIVKIGRGATAKDEKHLSIKINSGMADTYCITHSEETLQISVQNESVAKWMVYQFIEALSQEDHRFNSSDLPFATIQFLSHCKQFDFEYREPFLPTNLVAGNPVKLGTHSVDMDWGLWGHNLSKVVALDSSMAAWKNGERHPDQLCFSSPALFGEFSAYIIDTFGDGEEASYRFMIMPNDNDLVCMCDMCEKEGNSASHATPAVAAFIRKLAERFPNHKFFTSAYRTTRFPPANPIPSESGVFLSTIDLPQGVSLSDALPPVKNFVDQVAQWKNVSNHLYVWDYISNFDDYLTPLPILYSLQKRLIFFKRIGIKGVFLNGSGYDYSSFEDVKTYVAARLLQDIESDVDVLVTHFFKKFYGNAAPLLTNYYLQTEKDFTKTERTIDIYGGMKENVASYLDRNKFLSFYEDLEKTEDSPDRIKQLEIAMNFTRLQLAYIDPMRDFRLLKKKYLKPSSHLRIILSKLEEHRDFDNFIVYREEEGNLRNFVSFWREKIFEADVTNYLLNQPLSVKGMAAESGIEILTDGLPGFEEDYHQGWFISVSDISFEWTSTFSGNKRLHLRFLKQEKHGFDKPDKLSIEINGAAVPDHFEESINSGTIEISTSIKLRKGDKVKLSLIRKKGPKNKIALDEIRIN